ncbi:putative LRR receptor-like serine/threonine-protein kinase At1g53420 [Bidens hawaiensis]|uniref:putative LRR receptor-like serine/threonine-protein kinase At1g53420 n=1 Tax=Bidens hawaiensis TaxID=980011 RepID=UPI00404B443E
MLLIILCVGWLPFSFAALDTTCLSADEGGALNEIERKMGRDWDFQGRLCCDWIGSSNVSYDNSISCDCSQPNNTICRVTSISLKGQNLPGTLPPEFVNLRYLQNLDLTRNYLSGTIPPQWGSMERIVNISLIANRLNGSIPRELGNISTLRSLVVEDNLMYGPIPAELGNLTSIERLLLNANLFTGELPASFAKLTNMKEFRIGGNNLSGKIPDFIGQWTNLTSLRIQASGLEGPIPSSITLLRNLTDLDFSFNKLNGSIPERFSDLRETDYIYLTGNSLSGSVPDWMLESGSGQNINLFASSSEYIISNKVSCSWGRECQKPSYSLYIDCGGEGLQVGEDSYESDIGQGGPSHFSSTNEWGFSNTGNFLDDSIYDSYTITASNTSRLLMDSPRLYMNARVSALSLTYYGFCLQSGSYDVSLHFSEITFTHDETYSSLGRRVFDIYIQGVRRETDFDISGRAGGAMRPIVMTYPVNVTNGLEIRLYWAGKGTTNIPGRGVYGPLISAISVKPNFPVPNDGNGMSGGTVAGIVVGIVCLIIIFLGVLWWRGYLGRRDTMELELNGLDLNTGSFTLKQIKAATNNFDVANKIGEGGFGPVYKGVLPDGTLIAVKQLSSKSKQGNREFLNELGMISALQHPHLVKLHGCCIEGNQLLLAYEYMENNSLARALFGPKEWRLELDWPTRYRICIGIAKGLAFLHEESRLKIVHRDIKATNVLLDKNLNAKISDFGLAKLDEEDNTHISTRVAGTYGYMAPEYALRGYLTDKADVYSFGIVLLEIVSGKGNIADRAKENQFVLLDRAISLKTTGNLLELVDPKLDSKYDTQEMMVVINLSLACTAISPADRPAMSSVVRILERRIFPQEFAFEQTRSMTDIDRDKMMKQLEITNESHVEEMSIPYTDSSTSAVDLYRGGGFSEYLQNRSSDTNKLLS